MYGCPICLVRFDDLTYVCTGTKFGILSCGHMGHFKCLEQALSQCKPINTCPSCKAKVKGIGKAFIPELDDETPSSNPGPNLARAEGEIQILKHKLAKADKENTFSNQQVEKLKGENFNLKNKYQKKAHDYLVIKTRLADYETMRKDLDRLYEEIASYKRVKELLDMTVIDNSPALDYPITRDSFEKILKSSTIIKDEYDKQSRTMMELRSEYSKVEKENRALKNKVRELRGMNVSLHEMMTPASKKTSVKFPTSHETSTLIKPAASLPKPGVFDTEVGEISPIVRPTVKGVRKAGDKRKAESSNEARIPETKSSWLSPKKISHPVLSVRPSGSQNTPMNKLRCSIPEKFARAKETDLDIIAQRFRVKKK